MDRDMLAQMMLSRAMQQPPPPQWQPGPISPWAGLEANAWKNPAMPPRPLGYEQQGPTTDDIQLLHLLGRRRLPPGISGVGSP
jgi:hypothetical protein